MPSRPTWLDAAERTAPDGRRLATASDTVRIWDLDPLPIAIQRKPRELSSYEKERFGIK